MRKEQFIPGLFSLVIIVLILFPIVENWKEKPSDSFPLSYYPMFSKKRGASYQLYHLVGVDSLGQRHFLSYKLAGTGGFNQVRRQISSHARKGEGQVLLEKVKLRLIRKERKLAHALREIRLVKGRYHLERFFLEDDLKPLEEDVIATKIITL